MVKKIIIIIINIFFIPTLVYGLCKLGDRVKTSVYPYQVKPQDAISRNCTKFSTVVKEETCQSVYNRYKIKDSIFMKFNPNLDCSKNLAVGQKVCLSNGISGCLEYKTVNYNYDYDTCEKIASYLGITVTILKAINPGLDCNQIRMDIFCIEALDPSCPKLYLVQNGDTIESLRSQNNLTENEFYYLNPYITPSNLMAGKYICVTKQSSGPSVQSLNEVIQTLGKSDPHLMQSFANYLDNPTDIQLSQFNTILQNSMSKKEIRDQLKQLETSVPVLKDFYNSMGIDKSDICLKMTNSIYIKSRDCFCAGEPVMYCNGILQQEIHEYLSKNGASIASKISNAAASSRKKRAEEGPCGFGYGVQDSCGSFECCQKFTIAELCVGGEGCLLPDPFGEMESYSNPNYRLNSYFGLYGKLCIAFIKELLEESHVDQLINWDGCVAKVSVNILPIRSQTTVEFELNFLMYKFIISYKLQYDRPLPRCANKDHYCDFDYCFANPGSMSFDISFNIWRFITYENIWTYVIAQPTCDISKFNDTTGFTPAVSVNPTLIYNPDYQACYKNSYGNGAGFPLNSCPAGKVYEAGLCYDNCQDGYHGVAFLCHPSCRSGYTDGGIFCYTPVDIYGKGCCCTIFGCCGGCKPGYIDDGCTCRNPGNNYLKPVAYNRGVGTPMVCSSSQYQSGALCYPKCNEGYYGEGPVCWQSCKGGLSYNCGALCTKDADTCNKVILLAATSPLGLGFVHEMCT